MKVIVETSARHVHLSKDDLESLFGEGKELTFKKALSQPGQYACEERVNVIGPKGELKNVSILGPVRKETQVEVSLTEARKLGIKVPIRDSGKLENTPGCKLVGPNGEIEISKGVIAAKRHIHLDPETANNWGVENEDIVSVNIDSVGRGLTFGDVLIRVSDKFAPAMHIDTDESNASAAYGEIYGEIIK